MLINTRNEWPDKMVAAERLATSIVNKFVCETKKLTQYLPAKRCELDTVTPRYKRSSGGIFS